MLDEAIAISGSDRARFEPGTVAHLFSTALNDTFQGRDAAPASRALFDGGGWLPDGEFHFYVARLLSRSGQLALARQALQRAVGFGFFAARAFDRDPWLAEARQHEPDYAAVAAAAWERHRSAVEIFAAVGGYELLGLKREPDEHA